MNRHPNATHQEPPARPAWRRLWPVLTVVALVWIGVSLLGRWADRPPLAGDDALPLRITAFDGAVIDLAELRGQGVVLNFWASWCVPCRLEADLFEAVWRQERDNGIVFVGVNVQDAPEDALAFLAEFDITYPTGPDGPENWARRFGIAGMPATFFIDPDGVVRAVVMGPIVAESDLLRRIDAIRPDRR